MSAQSFANKPQETVLKVGKGMAYTLNTLSWKTNFI